MTEMVGIVGEVLQDFVASGAVGQRDGAQPFDQHGEVAERTLDPVDAFQLDAPAMAFDFGDDFLLMEIRLDLGRQPDPATLLKFHVFHGPIAGFLKLQKIGGGASPVRMRHEGLGFVRFMDVIQTVGGEEAQNDHEIGASFCRGLRLIHQESTALVPSGLTAIGVQTSDTRVTPMSAFLGLMTTSSSGSLSAPTESSNASVSALNCASSSASWS